MRAEDLEASLKRSEAFERWYAAQQRIYRRWYWAAQMGPASWFALGLSSLVLKWPPWLWLTTVPVWWGCQWAWREAYRRLTEGLQAHIDWMKAGCPREDRPEG